MSLGRNAGWLSLGRGQSHWGHSKRWSAKAIGSREGRQGGLSGRYMAQTFRAARGVDIC